MRAWSGPARRCARARCRPPAVFASAAAHASTSPGGRVRRDVAARVAEAGDVGCDHRRTAGEAFEDDDPERLPRRRRAAHDVGGAVQRELARVVHDADAVDPVGQRRFRELVRRRR